MVSRVRSMLLLTALGSCHLVFAASRADALVIPPKLSQLAQGSELIVLARVESVRELAVPGEYTAWATATVTEVWKGPDVKSVVYLASPTYACDISDALPGETVLLFLKKEEGLGWVITWSGRGRMPLLNRNGKDYVSHYNDVIFPDGIPEIPTPDKKEDDFHWVVELKIVRDLVKGMVRNEK